MIKQTKKVISIVLALMLIVTCCTALMVTANAASLASIYQTNPGNKVGKNATITIDGNFSDWSEDMKIAQGAAWDVANHWKGGHENCVLDTYSLYGAWDNNNLYLAWQMVNTTDTWAREGDGPLSDGGRVLDVPLIVALSVDPNSTSMSNKNTDGGPIWGQKMGLTFDTHVDRLLYMSGKVGLGEPSMFKAVDENGNTNYTTGCLGFKANGIEYAMAEGNIESSIMGLNYSKSPEDVFSDDSDWVDYKTFKGEKGVHNTKYDSFYEIKIPLSTLGIDVNYLETNGIGAMVVATRGESALDCIPYDPSMIDNATGDYASDPSTSHEKDDEDIITVPFARIGNAGGDTPTPTPTTAPVTNPDTNTDTLKVNATSNIATTYTSTLSKDNDSFNIKLNLQSSEYLANGQFEITYDPAKLKLSSTNFNSDGDLSIFTGSGAVINESPKGTIVGSFTNPTGAYDFTTEKALFSVNFDVIGTGETTVDFKILEMDSITRGTGNTKMLVENGKVLDAFNQAAKGSFTVSDDVEIPTSPEPTTDPTSPTSSNPTTPNPTTPVKDKITVNATSNLATSVSKTYTENDNKVNLQLYLQYSQYLANGEFAISYDSTKLKFNSISLPTVSQRGDPVLNTNIAGTIVGNFSSPTRPYDFRTESVLFDVTFDIIGSGTTTVDFNMVNMDAINPATKEKTKLVVKSEILDAFTQSGKGRFSWVEDEQPTTVPATDPTSSQPTSPKPTTPDILLGDVDLDGDVQVKDATQIQMYAAKFITLTEQQLLNGDVDFDGDVQVKDATLIQMFAAHFIDKF